jgi:hypothetical protein
MKRLTAVLLALALCTVAAIGFAADEHAHASMHGKGAKPAMGGEMGAGTAGTWKGEVLDAGCYLGHGAMGEKHKECALKCASNGMPLMLFVDGKAILLTPNHDNADPYNALKTMAGSQVVVTGTLSTRGGVSGIDVTGAKLASAK